MAKIKWAIIGVGKFAATRGAATAIAYAHDEGLKRNADKFELVGACARTPANLEAFAAEYPCRVYTDMRELYAAEKPEGVSICTFAKDRVEHVKCAIDAGVKYILVEKPVAMTLAETDEIRDYAEKRGVRLFVNFQRRFGRPFEMVKEAIDSGKLGRLYTAELWADKVGDMKSILRFVTPDGIENPALDENFHHGDSDKFLYFGRAFTDLASAIAIGSESRLDFSPAYLTQKMLS